MLPKAFDSFMTFLYTNVWQLDLNTPGSDGRECANRVDSFFVEYVYISIVDHKK